MQPQPQPIAQAADWQRQRALLLHREFKAVEAAVDACGGRGLDREMRELSRRLRGHVFETRDHLERVVDRRPLKASPATLYRALAEWRDGGRVPAALIQGYGTAAGGRETVPLDLADEIRRLATLASGGRNKDGVAPATFARNDLVRRWNAGESIPGLGTYREWWLNHPEVGHTQPPATAPDFPFSDKTIGRYVPSKALRKWGNVGYAAAKNDLPIIERDYSQLRRAELFTLDDVRLDLVAVDEFTSQVVPVEAYIMMEVGSRMIVSFILRANGKVKQRDVRALISAGLAVTGLPVDYVCHILFERGTLACSDELKELLEGLSEGRIQVHKTGMLENVRFVGDYADKARGNSAGKAVIESFNRSLHYRLLHLPGQRGNTRENQPLNLGMEDRDALKGTGADKGRVDRRRRSVSPADLDRPRGPETLVAYAERVARFKRQAAIHGFDCDLTIPLLTVAQLEAEVQGAIHRHNHEPGHAYQGHHQRPMVKGPGGVWQPLNDVTL